MNQTISRHDPREWSEAQRRAGTYLRTLRGGLDDAERELLAEAIAAAREEHRERDAAHPVTLVMEALFARLPGQASFVPVAMTPPMQRVSMLPEKTEFPLHDGLRRLFRTRLLPFAAAR